MTVPPLDPAGDPDRFDPAAPAAPTDTGSIDWVLDPSHDPDRFAPPLRSGQGETLRELIGEGAQEEPRDTWTWLIGLGAVIGFLLLVSLLAQLGNR